MAIERTTINGDWSAMQAALESLVPDYFAEVELSQDTYTLSCKDANDNVIFEVTRSANNLVWNYNAYLDGTHSRGTGGAGQSVPIEYFYRVGVNGAYMTRNGGGVVTIAKASNGKTAFTIPGYHISTAAERASVIYSACWGDDPTFTDPLRITDSTSPALGNNCLLVPVPLAGSYQLPNNIPKVFFLPVAQSNMRGIVQEVTSDSGTYITDGYTAMLYDAGGED